jgi:hypothetical protein
MLYYGCDSSRTVFHVPNPLVQEAGDMSQALGDQDRAPDVTLEEGTPARTGATCTCPVTAR